MHSLERLLVDGDELFNGFFEWFAGQYDPGSGGFYYARSSRTAEEFTPDIESTAQAMNIMERCGLQHSWTDSDKQQVISFFQSKQDPRWGFFYDDHPLMRHDDVMVGRALGYSLGALRKLGTSPLYPLPVDRHAAPDYCRSPEAYASWLRSVSLANSWRGCDRLCNSAPHLQQMAPAERGPYLTEAMSYFAEKQDAVTGLWGEGTPYVRISGTFKLLTFYHRFHIPLPRPREIYDSLLQALRYEEAVDMCYIRNPISLLSAMGLSLPAAELYEIADHTLQNMQRLKREDGGFSRELDHSPPAPNVAQVKPGEYYPDMPAAVPLGKGEVEGDMNAGTQAVLIRYSLRQLGGLADTHLSQSQHKFF